MLSFVKYRIEFNLQYQIGKREERLHLNIPFASPSMILLAEINNFKKLHCILKLT